MSPTLPALALSGLLALGGPAYGGAQAATPADTLVGPGSAVPYVAQGPLLCGGASAAMMQRFWNELGVYAHDYAGLVDADAGGIHTNDLADALERRGHRTRVLRDPDAAFARVRDGVPIIALLESAAARYHYVVVVAVGADKVRYHDPLVAPDRTAARSAFLERWAATGFWALTAAPAADESPQDDVVTDSAAAAEAGAAGAAARLPGQDSARDSGPLPLDLASTMDALRAGRVDSAAVRAERWLATAPADHPRRELAREMLAAARYLAGHREGALRAWNPDGPPVDLVRVRGLEAMRYRTAASPLGIEPGDVLTPASLRLARRRLLQLPAVAAGRVGYSPLRNGAVQVEVALAERRRVAASLPDVAALALGAAVNRRVGAEVGPFLGVGERWRVAGSWEAARPLAAVEVAVPWPPAAGVVTIGGGWLEEALVTGEATERRWGSATFRRWVSGAARVGVTLGAERWDGGPRTGRLGLSALTGSRDDRLQLAAAVDGWTRLAPGDASGGAGADRVARVRAGGRLRLETVGYTGRAEGGEPAPSAGRAWTVTLGGSLASTGAPPTLWDGAGTGRTRGPLLRGHPLIRDNSIGAAAFGRGLAHGTLGHAWFIRAGPARAALELFVDAARVWAPLVGAARSYLNPGVELAVTSARRTAAVSLARGDRWTLSLRVEADGLPWLRGPVR